MDQSFFNKLEIEIEFRDNYNEDYLRTSEGTVTDRVNQIIKAFEDYLGTFDPQSFKSVLTLMYS